MTIKFSLPFCSCVCGHRDVDRRDDAGRTALMRAAFRGDEDNVGVLLRNGADANARDADRLTPLILAAREGHARCVKILLRAGADADEIDWLDHTPLILAAWKGHARCVELLLKMGAGKEGVDLEGTNITEEIRRMIREWRPAAISLQELCARVIWLTRIPIDPVAQPYLPAAVRDFISQFP